MSDDKQQKVNIVHVLDTPWGEFRRGNIVRIVPNKPTKDMDIRCAENLSLVDKHFNVIVGKLKCFDEHDFTLDVSEKYNAMTIRLDMDDIEDMSIVTQPSYEIVKNLTTPTDASIVDGLRKDLAELQESYNKLYEGYHNCLVNMENSLNKLLNDLSDGRLEDIHGYV